MALGGILHYRAAHTVTFHEQTVTNNEVSEGEISWQAAAYHTCAAFAFSQTSRAFQVAAQQHYQMSQLLSLYYQPGIEITPRMSVMFRGRRLQILAVINVDEADQEIRIKCSEFQ